MIAQPPLYKVGRGRSEVYLKDDAALDEYLVDAGLEGLVLEGAGGQRSGRDLRGLVDHARRDAHADALCSQEIRPGDARSAGAARRARSQHRQGQARGQHRQGRRMARRGRSRSQLVGRGRRRRRLSAQAAVARSDRRLHHRTDLPRLGRGAQAARARRRAGRNLRQPAGPAHAQEDGSRRNRAAPSEVEGREEGESKPSKPKPRARPSRSPARPNCSTRCSPPAAAASRSSATKA